MNESVSSMITPVELWEAINGNPGIRPTKTEALKAAKACADAVDKDDCQSSCPASCTALIGASASEAASRYPADHVIDDPAGETGVARTDEYGYQECARRAFVAGVQWGCLQGLGRIARAELRGSNKP
jgi:hypothetical protein